jgi:hypothetical protein
MIALRKKEARQLGNVWEAFLSAGQQQVAQRK